MKPLRISFADTHDHLAAFFIYLLQTRYQVDIVGMSESPDFLLFGDDNFGRNNLNITRDQCTKILFTGENRRPENFDCDYAISFDHIFEPWHYRLPLYVIYMWALEHIHETRFDFNYIFNPEIKEKTDFWNEYLGYLRDNILDFDEKFVIYKTKNQGYHILYKCSKIQGNSKIAKLEGHIQCIIESRGVGGRVGRIGDDP